MEREAQENQTQTTYPWPEAYYKALEPEKRIELLTQRMTMEHLSAEEIWENQFRLALFQHRYQKRRGAKEYGDTYMKALLELFQIAREGTSRFSQKKHRKKMEQIRSLFWLDRSAFDIEWNESEKSDDKQELQKEQQPVLEKQPVLDKQTQTTLGTALLKQELVHLYCLYAAICMEDRQYRAVAFGYGKIKDQKVFEKIRQDFCKCMIQAPEATGMEAEFALFIQAGREAMSQMGLLD